ncbi:hypothetical protein D3C86_1900920 [compost metagenome]
MAENNVHELRNLVNAALAQKSAERRDARIVLQLARGRPFRLLRRIIRQVFFKQRFVIVDHGAKLKTWEHTPASPNPAMSYEDWPSLDQQQYERCYKY